MNDFVLLSGSKQTTAKEKPCLQCGSGRIVTGIKLPDVSGYSPESVIQCSACKRRWRLHVGIPNKHTLGQRKWVRYER